MTTSARPVAPRDLASDERWFSAQAGTLARLCHAMAERFARGGRLLACADTPAGRSDARHVAVEFVHPVIVGKRALPALCVEPEDVALLARPGDIVMAFGADRVQAPLARARALGCETVAFGRCDAAAWELVAPGHDPFVGQEVAETSYHVLWELVHVFFEHRGLLSGQGAAAAHDPGASSFLYPFLGERERDLDAVLADIRASILLKSEEAAGLRRAVLRDPALARAADAVRACLDAGNRLLALGNGGSATDAMDLVADLRHPPAGRGWAARPAHDLTEDPSVLTAIANDVGIEEVFARQVIAFAAAGDVLVTLSTSGGSRNVLAALAEARRRGLTTVAFVGYDGGRIAAEGLADHVVVVRSEHLPRIQEAHGTALHALREAVG